MEVSEILALVVGGILGLTVVVLLFLVNRSNRGRISVSWEVNHRPSRRKRDRRGRVMGADELEEETDEDEREKETEGGPHGA